MRRRSVIVLFAFVAVAGAGCSTTTTTPGPGSAAPSVRPSTPSPAVVTPPPATPSAVPTRSPTRTAESTPRPTLPPRPSPTPTPTFSGDAGLVALFPADIAGVPIEVTSAKGAEVLHFIGVGESRPELEAFLATLGRSLEDVSVAVGRATVGQTPDRVSIAAFRVTGADPALLLAEIVRLSGQGMTTPTTEAAVISGKGVTRLFDQALGDAARSRFIYQVTDTVFTVAATTDPLLGEVISKLP